MGKFLTYVLLGLMSALAWADTTILMVRHGEKPEAGLGQLTCQGLNRALALPNVLNKFGTPRAIYAPNPAAKKKDRGIEYFYIRPLATIEPYAIRHGIPVNISFEMHQTQELATHLLQGSGLQVVAWEHHLAATLARDILRSAHVDPETTVPNWADDDFDSIYEVHVIDGDSQGQKKFEFTHEKQNLNGLPEACPSP